MSAARRSTGTPRTDPTRAARLQRDAAMDRARSVTKGVAMASVGAVAVAGIYLSQALPGHAATTSSGAAGAATPSGASTGASPTAGQSYSSGYATAPQAPAASPAPAYQAPVVSSGSS